MAYIYDLTDTWNAGGTTFNAIKMNVTDSASAAGSKLVTLQTNGTEHFSVTKAGVGYFSGSLGIGTSSILSPLTVANGDISLGLGNGIRFYNSGNTNWSEIYNPSGGQMAFVSGAGEAMRIGTDGEVSIASTSSVYTAGNRGNLTIGGSASSLLFLGTGGTTGTYLAHFQSSNSVELWNGANGHMAFGTNNTERMRITSAGNVGIGTSSPSSKLTVLDGDIEVNATGLGNTTLSYNGTTANLTVNSSSASLVLGTSSTERMRITSAGNVGIGTSSPSAKLTVSSSGIMSRFQTGAATDGRIEFAYNTTDIGYLNMASATQLELYGRSGVALALGAGGSERMRIDSSGNVGIGTSSPQLKLVVSNSGAAGLEISPDALASSPLIQSYNRSGAAYTQLGYNALQHVWQTSGTERARIDSSGNLLVGKTSAGVSVGGELQSNGSVWSVMAASNFATSTLNVYSTGAAAYRFYVDMAGTIYATSTSISAISDKRLKENVRDLDAGLDTILALKPRRFDWKAGKGKDVRDDMGFIAQEVEEVLPELIGDWKSGEGDPEDLKSVKAGDLIPVLVKAIQELTARVAQLEGN